MWQGNAEQLDNSCGAWCIMAATGERSLFRRARDSKDTVYIAREEGCACRSARGYEGSWPAIPGRLKEHTAVEV